MAANDERRAFDTPIDRRAMIRRSLIAGGVAMTAPVITTFNVPAFAASPGAATTYRLTYTRSGTGNANSPYTWTLATNQTTNGCASFAGAWSTAQDGTGSEVTVQQGTATPLITASSGCSIDHVWRASGCQEFTSNNGGSTVQVTSSAQTLYVLVTCG